MFLLVLFFCTVYNSKWVNQIIYICWSITFIKWTQKYSSECFSRGSCYNAQINTPYSSHINLLLVIPHHILLTFSQYVWDDWSVQYCTWELLANAYGAGSGVAAGREGRGEWCGARGWLSAAGQRGRGREDAYTAAIRRTTSRTRESTRSTPVAPGTSSPRCRTRMHDCHYTYIYLPVIL